MPGSRPGGGRGNALGMLTAMFPSRISIIQSKQSHSKDYRFAFVFKFLFVFDHLPAVSCQYDICLGIKTFGNMMQKLHIFVLMYLVEWKSQMSHQGSGYAAGWEVALGARSVGWYAAERCPHSFERCLLKSCGRLCPR